MHLILEIVFIGVRVGGEAGVEVIRDKEVTY